MSLIQFVRILWARRLLIAAAMASCFAAAVVAVLVLPPRYEAHSRVMLDLVKPDPVTGQVVATQFARAYTKTQTELINDYRVAGRVVDHLGWLHDPTMRESYERRPPGDDRDLRRWLAQRVIDGADARLIEGSNILEITYTARSPETARQVADALREAYIDASLSLRRESAAANAKWYAAQAEQARAELKAAESRKVAFEREHGILLQPDKIDVESARLQALAAQAASAPAAPGIAPGAPSAGQLAQLDAQVAAAGQSLGPSHPEYQELLRRRSAVAAQVAQERASARAAAGAASASAGGSGRAFEAQKARVMQQRDKQEALWLLQSEVDLARDQLTKTAARAAEFRQEAEIVETGLQKLGGAVTPQSPVFPDKKLILAGSLAFGFAFGVLIGLLAELLNRKVRGVEDLHPTVPAPVLAVIPLPGPPLRTGGLREVFMELVPVRRWAYRLQVGRVG